MFIVDVRARARVAMDAVDAALAADESAKAAACRHADALLRSLGAVLIGVAAGDTVDASNSEGSAAR